MDALVNSTNETLDDQNALSLKLFELAGPELREVCGFIDLFIYLLFYQFIYSFIHLLTCLFFFISSFVLILVIHRSARKLRRAARARRG